MDGRTLQIRYRFGWLTAHCAYADGHPSAGEVNHLEQRIGPAFHGDILMEQVCDLLGLTLFGIKPPFTEQDRIKAAEKQPVLDWSGQTTYWEEQLQVTKAGGEHFVEALRAAFPDLSMLQIQWQGLKGTYVKRDTLGECEHHATIALTQDPARLDQLLRSTDTRLADLKDTCSYLIDFHFDWNKKFDWTFDKHVDKFRQAFGNEAILAEQTGGWIRGEFPTDAPQSADFVAMLYKVIDACFSRHASWVAPDGTVLQTLDIATLHSRDLAEWCRQSSHHYIGWEEADFGAGTTVAGLRAL